MPWSDTEFVGGPLDGVHPTAPWMNSLLKLPEYPEGRYRFFAGKYYWELASKTLTRNGVRYE